MLEDCSTCMHNGRESSDTTEPKRCRKCYHLDQDRFVHWVQKKLSEEERIMNKGW